MHTSEFPENLLEVYGFLFLKSLSNGFHKVSAIFWIM